MNLIRVMPAEESEMDTSGYLGPHHILPGLGPDAIAARLSLLRTRKPRVHAITNNVAQNFTANVLLAAGATPSTTISPEEISHFVIRADALLINLGTLDADRRAAIPLAIATAQLHNKPWVLDPVYVDASPPRLLLARACLAKKPTIVRANAAEGAALMEADAADLPKAAQHHGCVIALTGASDAVCDGKRSARVDNGHPLMARVTAMGCAGTALIAAFSAIESDAFLATSTALVMLGIAGEIAGQRASGPGSFPAAFLDALDGLDEAAIITHARIT
jgi:hydroxyethylthiazole kinase